MKPAFVGLAFGVGISLCASRARAAECERIEAADVDRALAAESSDVSTKHITLRTESGNLLLARDGVTVRTVRLSELSADDCNRAAALLIVETARIAAPVPKEPESAARSSEPARDEVITLLPLIRAWRTGAVLGAVRASRASGVAWSAGLFGERLAFGGGVAFLLEADFSSASASTSLGDVRTISVSALGGAAWRPALGPMRGDVGLGARVGLVHASGSATGRSTGADDASTWAGPSAWVGARMPLAVRLEVGVRAEAAYSLRPIRVVAGDTVAGVDALWLLSTASVNYSF